MDIENKPASRFENMVVVQRPASVPANRGYIFAKNCVNDHGSFVVGDKARGAFPPVLIASYIEAGILVESFNG